jgi:glycosyltransferase involved in cell wall biosynthesis
MKTIVQINSVINKGSTGKICQGIGELAQVEGWQHHAVFGRLSNDTSLATYRIGSNIDNRLHFLRSFLFDAQGLGSKKATEKLCQWLADLSPSIIHLHNLHGYYLNVPTLLNFLKKSSIPVVWTLHDCWAFTGHCAYYSDVNCRKWESQCFKCPKTRNYPKSLFIDQSKRNFELKSDLYKAFDNLNLIAVSDWLKNEVSSSILSDRAITTIHNGVDMKVFNRDYNCNSIDKLYKLKNKFVAIAAATSWGPTKGLADYKLISSFLAKDEVIVLIGLSKDVIKDLPRNIIGIERTENQKELARWYNRADVVLNLSTQETFGMTTIEGFACGTPVIVYNSTASPELIENGVGYIVEPGSVREVYGKMKLLRGEIGEEMSERCVSYAAENFNSQKQYKKYLELYDQLI